MLMRVGIGVGGAAKGGLNAMDAGIEEYGNIRDYRGAGRLQFCCLG